MPIIKLFIEKQVLLYIDGNYDKYYYSILTRKKMS